MQVFIIGNCQAESLARALPSLNPGITTDFMRLRPADGKGLLSGDLAFQDLQSEDKRIDTLVSQSDLVLFQHDPVLLDLYLKAFPQTQSRLRLFPRIVFQGFHPDMIRLGKGIRGATGNHHSSIAARAWTLGMNAAQTLDLFREDVFEALGLFEYWDTGVRHLIKAGADANLPLDKLITDWTARGVWMHTVNHPKLPVLVDMAKAILIREGLSFDPDGGQSLTDPRASDAVWSVYPDIAKRLGCDGAYRFQRSRHQVGPSDQGSTCLDLPAFIEACFKRYAAYRKEDFASPRLESARYRDLASFIRGPARGPARSEASTTAIPQGRPGSAASPYLDLPDHQFWRRALGGVPMTEVDPVVSPRFRLGHTDKVATAGSCFAQHIARTLQRQGFNYFICEGGGHLPEEEAKRRNYGVFSARYGNLYTARQLVQLFDRAYGRLTPLEPAWTRPDGRLVDPFRPQIEPDGFATLEGLESSRDEHYAAVRTLFEQLDVLVFTLGLTEAWRNRTDGAVYPLAPGVVAGTYDPDRHEFVNFTLAEVTADLQAFVLRLLRVNPGARLVLTVSPVPLIATYEDRHVLVSNTYSKSVLRVAAEEICRHNPQCAYFPSYEIITGNHTRGHYYEEDLRSVKQEGVDHVMRLFLGHYLNQAPTASLAEELMREQDELAEVLCDEEAIEGSAAT